MPSSVKVWTVAGFLLWSAAVGIGAKALFHYSNTPGRLAAPPPDFPANAGFQPAPGRAALIVFAHPQCSCSLATIGELAQIMAHSYDRVSPYVYVYAPRSQESQWVHSRIWSDAEAIPGVRVLEDRNGEAARRFGAATSGQTLLYDRNARLVFNGGITLMRGHSGDNDGRDAIVSLLEFGIAKIHTTPVFGCSLLEEE